MLIYVTVKPKNSRIAIQEKVACRVDPNTTIEETCNEFLQDVATDWNCNPDELEYTAYKRENGLNGRFIQCSSIE